MMEVNSSRVGRSFSMVHSCDADRSTISSMQSDAVVVGGVEKSHAVARGITAGSERDCQVTAASRSQRQHSVAVLRRLYISSHQSASSLVTMFF